MIYDLSIYFIDDNLLVLVNDLEMSFGKVEVIHETQFQNAAIAAGLTTENADELSYLIGLKSAANQELPAVIVIEKVRENIKDDKSVIETPVASSPPESVQEEPKMSMEVKSSSSVTSAANPSKHDSFIDMSMIKLSSSGYAGNFLDRHLVYSIEDQNRVVGLDHETRTCQVFRRFSDFVDVRDYLLAKYPFKCIPRHPAKRVQMFTDEAFLVERQKSLRRFLGIISHHQVYKSDALIQAFIYSQNVHYHYTKIRSIYIFLVYFRILLT